MQNCSKIEIRISGSIRQIETRATSEGFEDGDALGMYAVNYDKTNTVPGYLLPEGNQADNIEYVFDRDSYHWEPKRKAYYKDINTNVDIFLYYPYNHYLSDISSYSFEVKKDQSRPASLAKMPAYEASDFLWGKAVGISPQESKIPVSLSHLMSSLRVCLIEGEGFDEGEFNNLDKTIIVTNICRKAEIDLSSGTVSASGAVPDDGIVMCPQQDGSWRAVIVPQTVVAGKVLLSITVDGISYGFSYPEAIEYHSGSQRNMTVKVNRKSHTGTYEFELDSNEIVQWTEDDSSYGSEAPQYLIVDINNPGSLGETLRNTGKNPDKIRNLKLTGNIGKSDFYFMRDSMKLLQAINMKDAVVEDSEIPESAFKGKQSLSHFVFPDSVVRICKDAFCDSYLTGALYLPDSLKYIGSNAFCKTLITSIIFPENLIDINDGAFYSCSALKYSTLNLPAGIKNIGFRAFSRSSFSGNLVLPEKLESLGGEAFEDCGFNGSLIIPDGVTTLYGGTFRDNHFDGKLDLNNVTTFGNKVFYNNYFSGLLKIPEGTEEIPDSFMSTDRNQGYITEIIFPKSLKSIGRAAFSNMYLLKELTFNEGLMEIHSKAFDYCESIKHITFPTTIITIGSEAFSINNLHSITCSALEPPTSFFNNNAINEHCIVRVPDNSIDKYRNDSGWSNFKHFSGLSKFDISRYDINVLNSGGMFTISLDTDEDVSWSVQSAPEWLDVNPSNGIGPCSISVNVDYMSKSDTEPDPNGYYDSTGNDLYSRYGTVSLISSRGSIRFIEVRQYDSVPQDRGLRLIQNATKGSGIDVVFMCAGYSALDIARGYGMSDISQAYTYLFDVEPFKTYKDYFNVYELTLLEGFENADMPQFDHHINSDSNVKNPYVSSAFQLVRQSLPDIELSKSLLVYVWGTNGPGSSALFSDGSSVAVCPSYNNAYPYDFRGYIQHQAGGLCFGKLAEECVYVNTFINNCGCTLYPHIGDLDAGMALGWYRNISLTNNPDTVPWSHLIFNPSYSDYVDLYEGGFYHARGVFRSEDASCMSSYVPYFSSISRQAIVERIMEYSGQEFSLDDFYKNDSFEWGSK